MKEKYCQYRDNCEGRNRFVQLRRSIDNLDRNLCNNTTPHCVYFHGYERLERDSKGIVIGCSMPMGVM